MCALHVNAAVHVDHYYHPHLSIDFILPEGEMSSSMFVSRLRIFFAHLSETLSAYKYLSLVEL